MIARVIFFLIAITSSAVAADTPAPSPTETEVRAEAQAIINLLIQQRDGAMNQVAILAVELAKAKAQIETQKQSPKK